MVCPLISCTCCFICLLPLRCPFSATCPAHHPKPPMLHVPHPPFPAGWCPTPPPPLSSAPSMRAAKLRWAPSAVVICIPLVHGTLKGKQGQREGAKFRWAPIATIRSPLAHVQTSKEQGLRIAGQPTLGHPPTCPGRELEVPKHRVPSAAKSGHKGRLGH